VEVIEHLEGLYQVQEVPLGRVYRWRPECIIVECDCKAKSTLTSYITTCSECDTDHAGAIQEWLVVRRSRDDEATHPWRYATDNEEVGIPC
jgi:hypothetical protein